MRDPSIHYGYKGMEMSFSKMNMGGGQILLMDFSMCVLNLYAFISLRMFWFGVLAYGFCIAHYLDSKEINGDINVFKI